MNRIFGTLAVIFCVAIVGCSSEAPTEEALSASRANPAREGGENGGETGEESGTALSLNETYDTTRNGVRLVMAYNAEDNSFNGTVENITDETLREVRVEVHLSNGVELGPTTPVDLGPAVKREVRLETTSENFDAWIPHAEVGASEHSGSEDGADDEHSGSEGETGGEHG
ncbi:MAG: hypothetical protein F4184_04195 [Gemmatimonadetes bacterium]|nr:hypothetical protein [Gemmatimonadota bacterium]